MSYETEKNKIEKSTQKSIDNQNKIDILKKYTFTQIPDSNLKYPRYIKLIQPYNGVSYDYISDTGGIFDSRISRIERGIVTPYLVQKSLYWVDFSNFNETLLPFTKLIPKFYVADGFDTTKINFDGLCMHYWRKVSNDLWQLIIHIRGAARSTETGDLLPTYLDLDLYFMNEYKWEENNISKE
jgi:hypothetical protein